MLGIGVSEVSLVASTTGLGLFFDKLFATETTKLRIKEFVNSRNNDGSTDVQFTDYLNFTVDMIFNKILPYKFLTLNYFRVTTTISIASLIIVVLFQLLVLKLPLPDDFSLSYSQFLVIGTMFTANLLVDYVSIAQTHAFFQIARKQKTVGRSILLIASDFIITLNLFVLMVSQFVRFILVFFMVFAISLVIKLESYQFSLSSDQIKELPPEVVEFLPEEILIKQFFYDGKNKNNSEFGGFIQTLSNTENYSFIDVFSLYAHVNSLNLNTVESYFRYELDGKSVDVPYSVGNRHEKLAEILKKLSKDWPSELEETTSEKLFYVRDIQTVELEGPYLSLANNPGIAVGLSFALVDEIEDTFPQSLYKSFMLKPLDSLVENYVTNITLGKQIYGCFKEEWISVTLSQQRTKPCNKLLTYNSSEIQRLIGRSVVSRHSLNSVYLPLSSFFLTSFSLTFLIYSFLFFLFITRVFEMHLLSRYHLFEDVLLRSPFAIIGFIFGILIIVFQFLSWLVF